MQGLNLLKKMIDYYFILFDNLYDKIDKKTATITSYIGSTSGQP